MNDSIQPRPSAQARAIFHQGNQRDQRRRVDFCNYLLRFADLDGYPRRAQFIAAYSAGGSADDRLVEAMALADAGLLDATDIAYCAEKADTLVFEGRQKITY